MTFSKFFVKTGLFKRKTLSLTFFKELNSLHVKSWIMLDRFKGIYNFFSLLSFWSKNSFFDKNEKQIHNVFFKKYAR